MRKLIRTHRGKAILLMATGILVGAALASFVIARYVIQSDGGAEAQSPTGPSPLVLDMIQKTEADRAKPKFRGEIGGFTYVSTDQAQPPPACAGLPHGGVDATKSEISASDLNFSVGYLPSGMQQVFEGGNKCGDTIVAIVRNYRMAQSLVVVAHVRSEPIIAADIPQDRLQVTTVAGKAAVLESPVFDKGDARVLIHSNLGYFSVSSNGLSVDQLLQIAESVRSK